MMRLLAFLGDSVVIVSNESTVCRFNQIVRESPVRGYYDGCFNYSFVRRTQFRKGDSIKQIESRGFPFSCLVGISIEADGEVVSHVHTEGEDSNGLNLPNKLQITKVIYRDLLIVGMVVTIIVLMPYR